jgi:tetratricopeptide (TPR) repeat protein
MGIYFGPDGEKNWQKEQDELDAAVRGRWRAFNLEAEILARRRGGVEDPARARVTRLAMKAWGGLVNALRQGYGYADVCDLAGDALELDGSNADALAARAIARAKLGDFEGAVEDAAKAVALDPYVGAGFGMPASRLLQALRGEL